MARTLIPTAEITRAGVTCGAAASGSEVAGDPTNGMYFAGNDGLLFLDVRNTSGTTAYSVSFVVAATVDGLTVPVVTVSLAANARRLFGPFPPSLYNQSDGTVSVNIQAAGSPLKLRAYRMNVALGQVD